MKYFRFLIYVLMIIFIYSCSMTKKVPEGEYLLNDFSIKSDNKSIDKVLLEDFVRQKPNSSIPLIGRARLGIYNYSGDTVKWLNRFIQKKLGQPPVIFSVRSTAQSASQIQKELSNQGYLRAEVDTTLEVKGKEGKEMKVTYNITSRLPYKVRGVEHQIEDNETIARILSYTKRSSPVKSGILFDRSVIDEERVRKTNILRNLGYYNLSKESIFYKADTTGHDHGVDLFLSLRQTADTLSLNRYRFRDITIVSGYDVLDENNEEYFENPDTTYKKGITVVHGKNKFLRNSMLRRNNYLQPGRFYSDMAVSRTFSAFNGTGAIRKTDIELSPVSEDGMNFVDAKITLAPSNLHWFEAAIDGTNSAGDLGIAPSIAYKHQNIFNGAELFSVKLRGAYEFVNNNSSSIAHKNYYEYGIETSLSFPQFLFPWLKTSWREIPTASTQITLGVNNQHRSEYTRQFFNATYTFRWSTKRGRLNHSLDLIDINYVRMPSISTEFQDLLDRTPVLKATYENQLIQRTGYSVTYTWGRMRGYPRNSFTVRGSVDVAGFLPRLVETLGGTKDNDEGRAELLGIAYAEYFKTDLSFSQTRTFNKQQSFAYRIFLGVANPYGNSDLLPYEKRYFSGGANSVRGWSTRELGPGSYKPIEGVTSFVNQTGEIKFDASIEYRNKVSDLFELAGFIDAGNIWTIKDYEGQEGGVFKFNKFYKEIAASYGLGLRIDLSFLLLRLDFGMKAYDPSRDEGKRFIMFKPKFSRDFAWHFAIGYPF